MSFDEDLTARIVETRTELGIRRAADTLGVNPQTLVDSQMVQSAVGAIDLSFNPMTWAAFLCLH